MRQKTSLGLVLFVTALFISSDANAGWGLDSLWSIFASDSARAQEEDPNDIQQLRHFPNLVAELELLYANLVSLQVLAEATGMRVTRADELWKELLDRKVLRQFRARRALGVVVAGGTKTGKSSVFNTLAGRVISEVSPTAGATKQAVLIVPESLYDLTQLQLLYPDMELVENASPRAATEFTGNKQKLLVRSMKGLPDDIMFIDVPDVDSSETTNWAKAYAMTRSSDVVIAMITPEKHGDHAIIEFFRKVVSDAGKPIVVVVNKVQQSQLEAREWVGWLNYFCEEAGVNPIAAYVVPFDQKAAAAGKQEFYRVEGNLAQASTGQNAFTLATTPSILREDMAQLNVDTLKAQAQIGSLLQALKGEQGGDNAGVGGIVAYLNEIERRSVVYRQTLTRFEQTTETLKMDWPMPPKPLMVDSIGRWWDERHRYEFTKSVMNLVSWASLRFLWPSKEQLILDKEALLYREEQGVAIDKVVADQFAALSPLLQDSMRFLSPDSASLLGSVAQSRLLASLKANYKEQRKLAVDFETVSKELLPVWERQHYMAMTLLQSADVMAHVVLEPVITLSGLVGGLMLPGAVAGGIANNAGTSLTGSAAGGLLAGKVNGVIDSVGSSLGVTALLSDYGAAFAAIQLNWINNYIVTQHLEPALAEMRRGADVVESEHFTKAKVCVERLLDWAGRFDAAGSGG